MAEPRNPLGPTGERVVQNVEQLRAEHHVSFRELSDRLGALGRPIPEVGLSRLARGERRVDADDLVALAQVFGVTPNRLLLPERADDAVHGLTPEVSDTAVNLWRWAEGDQPLWGEDEPDVPWEPEGREAVEAFQRRARPPELRSVERHPAGRALEDVRYAVESVLTAAAVRGTPLPEDGLLRVRRGAAAEAPKQLRQSLQRLLREVEHLIDDLPDEHPDVLKAVEDGRDELRQIFNGRGNG